MATFNWEIQLMVRRVTNSGPSYTEIFRQWKTVLLTFYDQSSFTCCIQDDFKIHATQEIISVKTKRERYGIFRKISHIRFVFIPFKLSC